MKAIREEQKLSTREMATNLGITPSALWRIENGKVWPKPATVEKFCAVTLTPSAFLYTKALEAKDFQIPPRYVMPVDVASAIVPPDVTVCAGYPVPQPPVVD